MGLLADLGGLVSDIGDAVLGFKRSQLETQLLQAQVAAAERAAAPVVNPPRPAPPQQPTIAASGAILERLDKLAANDAALEMQLQNLRSSRPVLADRARFARLTGEAQAAEREASQRTARLGLIALATFAGLMLLTR